MRYASLKHSRIVKILSNLSKSHSSLRAAAALAACARPPPERSPSSLLRCPCVTFASLLRPFARSVTGAASGGVDRSKFLPILDNFTTKWRHFGPFSTLTSVGQARNHFGMARRPHMENTALGKSQVPSSDFADSPICAAPQRLSESSHGNLD